MEPGPRTLAGGTSAAHHRDSPFLHHFQSENPPGKPQGRVMSLGPAPPQQTPGQEVADGAAGVALSASLQGCEKEEGSQRPGWPA